MSTDKNSLTYVIQNIVVRLDICRKLNLSAVLSSLANSTYDPNRFPGLFLRINAPKSVLIIFRSGKIIITGIKLFEDIDSILEILITQFNQKKLLNNTLIKKNFKVKVVNIVITADLNNKIDLDLASLILENAIYEPEVFPGLMYKHNDPVKSTFLIFSTGKLVFTGIDRKEVIEPCLISIGRLLKNKGLFKH